MTFTRKSALTAACVAGLLSLSACGGNGDTEAFCNFVETADDRFQTVALSPTNEAIAAAAEGDMTGINAWGAESAENIDGLLIEMRDAEGNAPTEESANALGAMATAISTMKDISEVAATSEDLEDFFDEAEPMYMEIDEGIQAAGNIDAPIDEAQAEYCA